MSFLNLEGISKRFGEFVAVDRFTLSVEQGEFVSLLGPSGCGKTTTLQMIAGFLDPSEGRILAGGEDLTRTAANRRNIGIVFQSYALFPHLTAAENVSFGLEMRKLPKGDRAQRVKRALDLVHLGPFRDRYPKQLSGGQQQRVALARAIVIEPRILLLDEPMSNLDAKLREDMQLELRGIQQELGITTILVTHDQNEAMALSDRIAVMNHGRIVQVGTPDAIYENPADAFVSGFLGKSNLLPVTVERVADGRASVVFDGGRHEVVHGEVVPAEAASLSVRPEKVRLVAPEDSRLSGRVRARVFFGNHWLYQVDTGYGEFLVFQQNLGAGAARPGDRVGLAWDDAHARLLAQEAS